MVTYTLSDGNDDRLLIGVAERYKTAFYIVIEDTKDSPNPMTIANKLVALLPN
ncbi:MAG: hypothetical protein IJ946_08780 [Clostridia bacterium]|nr:hypothetical protein [Clostridia bacterium]